MLIRSWLQKEDDSDMTEQAKRDERCFIKHCEIFITKTCEDTVYWEPRIGLLFSMSVFLVDADVRIGIFEDLPGRKVVHFVHSKSSCFSCRLCWRICFSSLIKILKFRLNNPTEKEDQNRVKCNS